jgi:hypothetical protein
MKIKRAIPRVAVASLTLGGSAGAAVVGCGGGGSDEQRIENFCQHMAECYGYGASYVRQCTEDMEQYFAYYSSSCQRAIRRAMSCIGSLSCGALQDGQAFYSCYDEWMGIYDNCYFDYYAD